MRQIWKFPLFTGHETTCVVSMPEGAQIIHFDTRAGRGSLCDEALQFPTIWASVDTYNPVENRRFTRVMTGIEFSRDARYVGTYKTQRRTLHVVELLSEPLPPGVSLPADGEVAFRTMAAAGFRLGPGRTWIAPDREPHTTEQMMAIATLQEHGFGSVVYE